MRVASALRKMLATLPLPSGNANPEEAVKVYFEVCQPYHTDMIELAIQQFVEGKVVGHNKAFAPTAAQLSNQIRVNTEHVASLNRFDRAAREQLQERDKDEAWMKSRTPESRERVKAIVEGFKEAEKERTPEQIAASREMVRRTDELFASEFVDHGNGVLVSSALQRKLLEE